MARVTYLVHGFHREDHGMNACMLVDLDQAMDPTSSPHQIAELYAPHFRFHACQNVTESVVIPDDCKRRVFGSDEELYDAVPALRPPHKRKRRTRGR
jgi:hypothetical protein